MENPCGATMDITKHVREKFLFLYSTHPRKTAILPAKKDISLFFSGQIDDYRKNRRDTIEYLADAGRGDYIFTADRAGQLSKSEYFATMARARMVLNFSQSVDFDQLKGRVFEAMFAQCLLLETRNPQIECLFKDGLHYVAFDSKEDLLEKISFYEANPDEAERIARNARELVMKSFTTENFWTIVHDTLGIDLPSQDGESVQSPMSLN